MKFDMKDPKTQRIMTYITVILVLAVGIISTLFRGGETDPGYLTFHNEGYLTITDEAGTAVDVYYTDMISVEYLEAPDFGEADGGSLTEDYRLGQWTSPQLGTYITCTEAALDSCVFIQTENGAYAVSYESDATTQALQQAILEAQAKLGH